MKKKRKQILETTIILIMILFAAYGVVKRVIISQQLKKVIITKLRPMLQADTLDIAAIDINLTKITINKVNIARADYLLKITDLKLKYSLVKLFQKGMNIKEWLESIKIEGINYTLLNDSTQKTSSDWKLDIASFKEVIRKTEAYAYLDTIEIKDFSISIEESDKEIIPVLSSLDGNAIFGKNHNIKTTLQGKIADSKKENVLLTGNIDYEYLLAHFNLEIKESFLPKWNNQAKQFSITGGSYKGKFILDINRLGNERVDFSGNITTKNLSGTLLQNIDFSDISLGLSFYNGTMSVNRFDGKMIETPFSITGAIYNFLDPELDLYLSMPEINKQNIDNYLKFIKSSTLADDFLFGNKHTLSLHAHGLPGSYSFDFDYNGDIISFKKRKFEDITIRGDIKKDHLNIHKISAISGTNALNLDGNFFFSGDKANQLKLNYNATGSLYSEISLLKNTRLASYSTILNGKINYLPTDGLSVSSKLETYDFSKSDSALQITDLNYFNNKLILNSYSDKKNDLIRGEFNLKDFHYSLQGKNIVSAVNLFLQPSKKLNTDESIELSVKGDKKGALLTIYAQNPQSLYHGKMDAEIIFDEDSITANTTITPMNLNFNLPIKTRLKYLNNKLLISNLKIANKAVTGTASINFNNFSLFGNLQTDKFDFGNIYKKLKIKTETSLNCNFSGTLQTPYLNLKIKENGFILPKKYRDNSDKISGNCEIYLENKKIRIEQLKLYSGNSKLLTLTGYLKNFNDFYFSSFGRFELEKPFSVFGIDNITGKMDFRLEGKGTLDKPQFTLGELETKNLNIFGQQFDYIKCFIEGEDETKFKIKELKAFSKDKVDLTIKGFVPYSPTGKLQLNGYFLCDAFSYLVKNVPVISAGRSVNEGDFSIKGVLNHPELSKFNLYFLDGFMELDRIVTRMENIKGKITLEEGMFFKLQDITAVNKDSGHKVLISSCRNYQDYEEIILPLGINFGIITLKFPEGGVTTRIPGLMKEGNYGNMQLSGHNSDKFVFAKRRGNFTLSGKVLLRNTSVTFPFLSVAPFGNIKEKTRKKKDKNDPFIFDFVDFDLDVIPVAGNSFFYKTDTDKKKGIWERFKESIFSLNKELNNVYIPLDSQKKGLKIKGFYNDPHKFTLTGEIQGRDGSLNYSALSFKLDKASITFDGYRGKNGYQNPYLTGIGKTRVRSRVDSTNIVGYEDIFIKVLTIDDGEIVDQEGARISEYSIQLQDADGNSWIDRNSKNSDQIDTEETVKSFLSDAVDQRVFSPLLSPLETALGNLLGAYIAIKPKVTSNLQNEYSYDEGSTYSFGNLLEGSEVYVSKFITDKVALSWNAEYIGDDDYKKELDKEFGYRNKFSLDYQLTNHLTTSYGYEYNSITEKDGYMLSLSYRRRFMSLGSVIRNIKKIFK